MDAKPQATDEISALVEDFFAVFVDGDEAVARAAAIRRAFLPSAVIVNMSDGAPTAWGVEEFLEPRVELMTSGRLPGFAEWPVDIRVDVIGDVAHVWCRYEKSWTDEAGTQTGAGTKSIQLARTDGRWRISAIIWQDEGA